MNDEQSKLLLLGIGGGGCRLAAAVRVLYGDDMRVLCMDTDALANREVQQAAPDIPCVLFGGRRLAGNGAGGDYAKGMEAFKDDAALLENHLTGVRTVIMLACLGAGTGSGAAIEAARMLKQKGIATFCVATLPFSFEGSARQEVATRTKSQIEENVESLAEIPLDDLFDEVEQGTVMAANEAVNDMLASALALLWRLLDHSGLLCIDPERLYGLVMRGGNVRFCSEAASGKDRVGRLLGALHRNRLLKGTEALGKANAVLVGILGGTDLCLAEIREVMDALQKWCQAGSRGCRVEMGTVLSPAFDGRIEIIVFTFENWKLTAAGAKATSGLAEPPAIDTFESLTSPSKWTKKKPNSKLTFGQTGRGKFQNVEPTLSDDQKEDLDIPTFLRRNLPVERSF